MGNKEQSMTEKQIKDTVYIFFFYLLFSLTNCFTFSNSGKKLFQTKTLLLTKFINSNKVKVPKFQTIHRISIENKELTSLYRAPPPMLVGFPRQNSIDYVCFQLGSRGVSRNTALFYHAWK